MADYQYKSRFTRNEIDERLERAGNVSNPNLLDNWYFGNPVNQRGQTEYTKQWTYCIDRWLIPGSSVPVKIVTGGISFNTIDQLTGEILPDGRYTLSILTSEGVLYSGSAKYTKGKSSTLIYGNGVVDSYLMGDAPSGDYPRLRIQCVQGGNAITILAVKLELGSQQTLAHQDADGNWVLNEIPDYGEQLRRCQRYFRKIYLANHICIGYNAGGKSITFAAPGYLEGMRATPALQLFYTAGSTNTTDGIVIAKGDTAQSWSEYINTASHKLIAKNLDLIIISTLPSDSTAPSSRDYTLMCGAETYVTASADL